MGNSFDVSSQVHHDWGSMVVYDHPVSQSTGLKHRTVLTVLTHTVKEVYDYMNCLCMADFDKI